MMTELSPQEFVDKWRHVELKERSAAQEHFIDICRMLGHPTPAEGDPRGEGFLFEAGADKSQGGRGWADVWKRGFFAWEYKGKHANLDEAFRQLLQYREALENPPLLIVSDTDLILIHTNFTNSVKRTHRLGLPDLLTQAGVDILRSAFYEPEALRATQTPVQVTREAAAQFARLAECLQKYGEEPERVAHFLIRLLFCLFAEDAGLLPHRLFALLVERARARPGAFADQLRQLFGAMAHGGWFGADEIRHFDGRLFDDDTVMELDSDALDMLGIVSCLDWSSMEPSIIGTLFERSLNPGKRSQLGAHYTSKEDIMLIVEPVLMTPLRERWQIVQNEALKVARQRDDAPRGPQRTKLQKRLASMLTGFAQEVAKVQVLDPACGSGNFLYVALRMLLDLEKEVINFASMVDVGSFFPSTNPAQCHGIEVNEYAHQLAQATIWIGYIQWLRENGFGIPTDPLLKPLDNIHKVDAILAYDQHGDPTPPDWPDADIIISNPPFLGGKRLRSSLGDEYVDSIFRLYEGHVPREADLVCYWFERVRAKIEEGTTKRAGLLATQAIRGGANREILKRIKETGDIFWAISDREWILEGANVHVSLIGFDDGTEKSRILDGNEVSAINPDLTASADVTRAVRLEENSGICYMGITPVGPFVIPEAKTREWLALPANPNNRRNSDVLHPYLNGQDITEHSRGMWIIDFGVDAPREEASLYESPFQYVVEHVKPFRESNKREAYREKWWLHGEPRPSMRRAIAGLPRYIVTPRVSKHRLFAWVPSGYLVDSATFLFAREDDFFFGILHSRCHEVWARATGTQLREAESGFRYTPRTTFDTFPFPWPPGKEPIGDPLVTAISEAGKELNELRVAWLHPPAATVRDIEGRTLTVLYNSRPEWLAHLHDRLDAAVLAAYVWPPEVTDAEILEGLLELNASRGGSH